MPSGDTGLMRVKRSVKSRTKYCKSKHWAECTYGTLTERNAKICALQFCHYKTADGCRTVVFAGGNVEKERNSLHGLNS